MIVDNFGRPINYLRLSVTDRCNLRCFYCMPAEGIHYLSKDQLLSYEEMYRIVKVLVDLGITKIRITGGEPFVRKDLIEFLKTITGIKKLESVSITTNGVLTGQFLHQLLELGITRINLSLDSVDKNRFFEITRRDLFDQVMKTLMEMLSMGFQVKINTVVMEDKNIQDLIPLAKLSQEYPVDVRFIEEMPFNGSGKARGELSWNHIKILNELKKNFPKLRKLDNPPATTTDNYQVPGFKGKTGIIAAYSRTFCGTCNRIRITAQGQLKTCLYGEGVMDLKQLAREGISDQKLRDLFLNKFKARPRNGFEAEKQRIALLESMSEIGG